MNPMALLQRLSVLAIVACVFASGVKAANVPPDDVVRVMTFNLWHGGEAGKQPLDQTAKVFREAKADVFGLQETAGYAPKGAPKETPPDNAAKLAKMLGWHYHKPDGTAVGSNIGVISRYPIVRTVGDGKLGATIQLPSGGTFTLFNVHFAHAPYQPYQLLNIPYANAPFLKTTEEAVAAANMARRSQVEALLAAIKQDAGAVAVVTGDFNEPSCLDWTPAVAAAKRQPLVVEWPATKALLDVGFMDAFRKVHPDPIERPGMTWTPTTRTDDPKDHHDRIDFVLVRGKAAVQAVEVVGETKERADVVVTPYPSDHRAVVATLKLTKP